MLADVKFDVPRMNSTVNDIGVLYHRNVTESESGVLLEEIIGTANTDHPNWQYMRGDSNPRVFHAVQAEKGIYYSAGGNFHVDLHDTSHKLVDAYAQFTCLGNVHDDKIDSCVGCCLSAHGVADNVEQVKKRFANVIANPDVQICIALMPVFKSKEPEDGGWRWHKWGEYIGTQNPQCEYLYNEPDIDLVLCFHVYVVEDNDA